MRPPGHRLRLVLRLACWALVAVWFLVDAVRAGLPFWVPFVALIAAEVEYLARALGERGREAAPERDLAARRQPGEADADLGWGSLLEDVDEAGNSVVRWVPPPARTPAGSRRALYAAGVLLAVGLFVLAFRADRAGSWHALPPSERAAAEARFRAEAVRISGRAVRIHCDERYSATGVGSDALGVAFVSRGLAYLLPDVCRRLHAIANDTSPDVSERAGEAILVLAHEAVHLGGETREGVTECLALQEGVGLAQRLGYGREDALRLMRTRYEASLAERSITRITYRLPTGCRDGGALDLRPADPAFP